MSVRAAGTAWGRMLATIGAGVVLMTVWGSALAFGPVLERALFPHTTGPYKVLENTLNADGSVSMRFSAVKHRECTWQGSQWYINRDGAWQPTTVRVTGLPIRRPTGVNISPVNTLPEPGTYILRVALDCGWPWLSTVTMGPFDLT